MTESQAPYHLDDQAENQRLRKENEALQAKLEVFRQLRKKCEGLRTEQREFGSFYRY
ncbi:MAG: hypothetical protein QGD88_01605 [Anaerolineae bacterium]|nr:hypothetical protein [Anaerolineae bacterium]